MNVCIAITEILKSRGVTVAFGIPGLHNMSIYRALHECGFEIYTVRHEQCASFMADGYARVSGNPALCAVIDGPGFLNASTGIAQARADSVPMVVLTPCGSEESQGSPHELCGQTEVSRQICKASFRVNPTTTKSDVESFVDQNLSHSRPGPLHIEIPLSMSEDELKKSEQITPTNADGEIALSSEVKTARQLVNASKRPLIVAGGGAVDAQAEVQKFAESIDAPVLNTVNGKGILPLNHPLRVGSSPSIPEISNELQKSDLIIAVGTELSEIDFDFFMQGNAREFEQLIRMDIDPNQVVCNAIPT